MGSTSLPFGTKDLVSLPCSREWISFHRSWRANTTISHLVIICLGSGPSALKGLVSTSIQSGKRIRGDRLVKLKIQSFSAIFYIIGYKRVTSLSIMSMHFSRTKSTVSLAPSFLAVDKTAPDANRFGDCIFILLRYVNSQTICDI